ncbi:MAG: hypothetical protein SangKO_036680 [Sandaracinaceae bacterium]
MDADISTLAGRPLGDEWPVRFHIAFVFEVPLGPLEAQLPDGLSAMEPVPGVGLLSVIHARYAPGTLGRPSFDEIVCSALVAPDLSVDMPPPRLTFYVLRVASNDATFVAHKIEALKMPVFHVPSLRAELDEDRLGTRVRDDDGEVMRLRYRSAAPHFAEKSFPGQYFADPVGPLHIGAWRWRGRLAEQQRRARGVATLGAGHPFFARAGLRRSDPSAYLQQVSAPDEVVRMWTYEPWSAR